MADNKHTIGIIGIWHLGETFAAGLSELGHTVIGYDSNPKTIEDLKKGIIPIAEPSIDVIIKDRLATKDLSFTNDPADLASADVIWFTFDTPVNDKDEADMDPIFDTLKAITPHLNNEVCLVVTIQVPVGTTRSFRKRIAKARPDLTFSLAYTPENLQLGRAMDCFFNPVRTVIGAETLETGKFVESLFAGISAEYLHMSLESAEMAKHALNAYLATSVSFINDIADLCEKTGADVLDVAKALRSDSRIGQKAFLDAGLGFSGGTLGRDLKALEAAAKAGDIGLHVVSGAYKKNHKRKDVVATRVKELAGVLKAEKMAILGLTYKPGTKTLRRSRALEIAADLSKAGAVLALPDPAANER